jgi:hypothetical protein
MKPTDWVSQIINDPIPTSNPPKQPIFYGEPLTKHLCTPKKEGAKVAEYELSDYQEALSDQESNTERFRDCIESYEQMETERDEAQTNASYLQDQLDNYECDCAPGCGDCECDMCMERSDALDLLGRLRVLLGDVYNGTYALSSFNVKHMNLLREVDNLVRNSYYNDHTNEVKALKEIP